MKQTILHRKHLEANARMTDFQGWQIPIQFSATQDEYHAVRAAAGLFDIGYLGRIEISGMGATPLLQKILTRSTAKITMGSAHYSLICNESGFILDDVVVLHPAGNRYLLTTNACNTDKILLWLKTHASHDTEIEDKTQSLAQFELQGPQSFTLLDKIAGPNLRKMKPRAVRDLTIQDTVVMAARIGCTGEQCYELFIPADRAGALWDTLLTAGGDIGLLPCGFACRDILRVEMGRLLYGNELDETRTPLEAGLTFFIDFKEDFIGKEALLKLKADGVKQKLAGFVLLDKEIPKSGGSIFSENHEIGVVTSSVQSPQRRAGIGLGYVVSRYAQAGQEIEIEVRDREISAKIVDLPFNKKSHT